MEELIQQLVLVKKKFNLILEVKNDRIEHVFVPDNLIAKATKVGLIESLRVTKQKNIVEVFEIFKILKE